MPVQLGEPLVRWYAAHARTLPWRDAAASPWAVLVSEVMLQQTPVVRVLPAFSEWQARWPDARSLSAATPGEAVRQWGTLGYPRRAIRLHAAARELTCRYDGEVPRAVADLRALPGVGAYTAAAVASFAFGQRHAVMDVNVRRVLSRLQLGSEPGTGAVSAAEVALAESLLPADGGAAARWSVAVMELGALLCRPARPACADCPVAAHCAWLRAGRPAGTSVRPRQRYQGSDRQCRGAILAELRAASGPVAMSDLGRNWPDQRQRARALRALTADGLVVAHPEGMTGLPGEAPQPPPGLPPAPRQHGRAGEQRRPGPS